MGEIVYQPSGREITNYLRLVRTYGKESEIFNKTDIFCQLLGRLIVAGEAQIIGTNVTDGGKQANAVASLEGVTESIIIGDVTVEDGDEFTEESRKYTSIKHSFMDGTGENCIIKNSTFFQAEVICSDISDSNIGRNVTVENSTINSSSVATNLQSGRALVEDSRIRNSTIDISSDGVTNSSVINSTGKITSLSNSVILYSTNLNQFSMTNGKITQCRNLTRFNIFGLKLNTVIDSCDVSGGDTLAAGRAKLYELSGSINPTKIVFSKAPGQPKQIHFT